MIVDDARSDDHRHCVSRVPLYSESAADFWESMPRDWPGHPYDPRLVDDLHGIFQELTATGSGPIARVLDCGCGTGNPAIGLAKRGYQVVGVDADPEMVRRFRQNCQAEGQNIQVLSSDWRDLNGEAFGGEPFDAVVCRGNSLIYAANWDRDSFIPEVAHRAIRHALRRMTSVLRPRGVVYVDITNRSEYEGFAPKFQLVGARESESHHVVVFWVTEYDVKRRIRRVHATRVFQSKEDCTIEYMTSYMFVGYMLYHEELISLAKESGLEVQAQYVNVPSEHLYDVFLFRRP